MNSDQKLVQTIYKDLIFTENEIKTIASVFKRVDAEKGAILIKPGDIVTDIFFIYEGCLRTFYTDKHGKEHTIQIGIRDWWISDFTAFFSNSKAIMHLEVLQDATLYQLSSVDREELHMQFPKIHKFIRNKLEKAYAAFQKRILSSLSMTAKERYLEFIKTHLNIEKNVKNYHIASYLGMTTESLSRIRKELT
ncbi:Crp/Fnr family transcriptional regulator [Winogradskyella schleiferi]|uniref:Crp/Fnr family transcriptional regulator n=1 Tax=Winogradskyella schleiferi TaxID=2686078 RepID=UPI0015BC58D6|nr:Crp/Fnr family transcriptional regulator [Winogradskyella schleiferi]